MYIWKFDKNHSSYMIISVTQNISINISQTGSIVIMQYISQEKINTYINILELDRKSKAFINLP